jgi:hypothetical protein
MTTTPTPPRRKCATRTAYPTIIAAMIPIPLSLRALPKNLPINAKGIYSESHTGSLVGKQMGEAAGLVVVDIKKGTRVEDKGAKRTKEFMGC